MKILLLTQVVPWPPDSGPRIKTFNVLRYLAERHEVHLVSFVRSPAEQTGAEALRRYCLEVTTVPLRRSRWRDVGYLARSFATGRPFLVERDDSSDMRRVVATLADRGRFDAVHADQLSMAQFAIDLRLPLRVLDQHNAVWTIVQRAAKHERGPRRLAAELEWRKLRAYEQAVCRRFDRVVVVSEADRRGLTTAVNPAPVTVTVPIAVDVRELAFEPRTPDATTILSLATMFYPPNAEGVHWFATEVLPLVRRQVPSANFLVVGSRPPHSISALGGPHSGIEVTGYVADLGSILRRSAVLVVPLHSGSGMRVKILEAFARGLPIVSTSIGVEGIEARSGEHLLVADQPAAFAQAVCRLLSEPAEAARLSAAGRALVEARYDWRTALAGLETIYPLKAGATPGVDTLSDLQEGEDTVRLACSATGVRNGQSSAGRS